MKKPKTAISKEDAETFTDGLGHITAGSYRLILLADKQGVPQALGYESTRDWVNERLGGYVRHPIEERQKIVGELAAQGETQKTISRTLGINTGTVHYDSKKTTRTRVEKAKRLENEAKNNGPPPDEPPPGWYDPPKPAQVEAKLQAHADQGLEALIWDKVKDRFIPFWLELLESLDPDERDHLWVAIENQLAKIHYEEA